MFTNILRFEEVTERFEATVNYPGNVGGGLPMNVAIPSLKKMRIWQAIYGGYTWVISYEPGLPEWSEEERIKWVGYTASYRREDQNKSSQTIYVEGGVWDSFVKAEEACKRAWKQIRSAS